MTRAEKGVARRRWTYTAKLTVVALSLALTGAIAFALLLLLATPSTAIRYVILIELMFTVTAAAIGIFAAREWWLERTGLSLVDHIRVRIEQRRTRA